jgi:predicted O-linked N-acetylglucosamine transferase (SPINDLY family)
MAADKSDDALPHDGPTPHSSFEHALRLYRQGDALPAEVICMQVLRTHPGEFRALNLLGLMALQRGDAPRAIGFINRSLAIRREQPMALATLGSAQLLIGRPEEAIASLESALRADPNLSSAWFNRGNAQRALGRLSDALASYEAAAALDGSHAPIHCNRALVLIELGRHDEGLTALDQALAIDPCLVLAHRNRAVLLLRLRRAGEALDVANRALQLAPADPHVACLRGDALLACERLDDAIMSYTLALQRDPTHVESLINRSSALQRAGRLSEALADCEAALALVPGSLVASRNAGNVLLALERPEEALSRFATALRLAPDDEEASVGYCASLSNVFHRQVECCEWGSYEAVASEVRACLKKSRRVVNPLLLLLLDDPPLSLQCARQLAAERYPQHPGGSPSPTKSHAPQRDRIRVAYVSADFGEHPVSHLLVGVLERHDRSRFEVIGVSLRARAAGAHEDRVRGAFDRCVDVHEHSDQEVAALMRSWGVDIAVDLMGWTDRMRLGIFACRAAPIQVNYLGYAGTTGAPYMDYLLADAVAVPVGTELWYTEKIMHVPGCFLPYDDRGEFPSTPSRASQGLPDHGFVFCAFTKPHKINPTLFGIWLRLLEDVEASVLWLRDMGAAANANLLSEAAQRGVNLNRLIFAPRVTGMAEHIARHALADLYLDTFPYNAHSTACDALWAGLPVLTCAGVGFGARVAASVLTALGIPELIAHNLDDYQHRAGQLATNARELRLLREKVASQRRAAALFDTTAYTRNLEAAFERMLA